MRILVVEDSEDFRLLLELTLRDAGYDVDAVACAEDGVELLEARTYQLILCDYSLPGHSGVWLLSQVTERTRGEIPCVLVTGDPDAPGIPPDAVVIRKPLDFDRLLSEIQYMVAGDDISVRVGVRPMQTLYPHAAGAPNVVSSSATRS